MNHLQPSLPHLPVELCAQEWIDDMKHLIQTYFYHGPWRHLDRVMWNHSYNLGDLRAWPLDATIVYESSDMVYVLGSLKSAANLAEVAHICGVQVNTLVTLCAKELQAKGTPKSLDAYLRLHSAQQCVYALDDLTVKVAQDPTLYTEQAQKNCRVWSEIARTLNARRAMLGKKQVVLFHCFGGIHRSPAALAATLMAREGLQAQEAIEQILRRRPSLRPWKNRDYILWALKHWETLLSKHAHAALSL